MKTRQGQSLVELLIAFGLAAVLLPALLTSLVASRSGRVQSESRFDATGLVRESVEAVRSARELGWSNISTNGTYHPVVASGRWTMVTGSETVNGMTRSIVISGVNRNATGQIVTTGGTNDPSTKKATVNVSWTGTPSGNVQHELYLTRFLDNLAYLQTTQADFLTGTLTNSSATNVSGGEVTLATNTKGKWCEPQLSTATIDLPDIPNAVSAIPGHVFAATGQTTNTGQESFSHVIVGDTSPPTFSIHGKLRGYKTTAVYGDANYAYLATTNDSKEIVIVNLNQFANVPNKLYQEIGSFNATGSTDAESVFVFGGRGYMTAGNYLYVFDLASAVGSRPQIGSRIQFANAGDTAGGIFVKSSLGSTYVYIAIVGSTPEEMKIANVTNSNNANQWKIVGNINIEPNACSSLESGKAVYVRQNSDRAYISSVNDATFKEFFVVDTQNKSTPSLLGGFATNPPCTNGGGYEANGLNPSQSTVVGTGEDRGILVGVDAVGDAVNSEEYQVLNMSNEAMPARCGGMQINTGIYGVAAVTEADGDAYAYLITGDSSNDLKVVQGGPDGTYYDSGTYLSPIVDMNYTTGVNRIAATTTLATGTNITFQIAIADVVSGSCAGANYVFTGPDGTNATFFPATGGVAPTDTDGAGYENPGRCMRIKAFLTGDTNHTPTLSDFTINYSP